MFLSCQAQNGAGEIRITLLVSRRQHIASKKRPADLYDVLLLHSGLDTQGYHRPLCPLTTSSEELFSLFL